MKGVGSQHHVGGVAVTDLDDLRLSFFQLHILFHVCSSALGIVVVLYEFGAFIVLNLL
jgi:hypothetical protein